MRRREYHWSLYNEADKNQLDGLRTDQVEAVFAALPKQLKKAWLIWKDGFDGWKPFEDFPEILVSLRRIKEQTWEAPPPPPASSSKSKSGAAEAAAGVGTSGPSKLVMDETRGASKLSLMQELSEDRSSMRFLKVLSVKIYVGDTAHKNKTVDISLKGMQVRDPLPKRLPKYFNVDIHLGERVIPVVCSEVPGTDGAAATRLRIEANEHASALLTELLGGSA